MPELAAAIPREQDVPEHQTGAKELADAPSASVQAAWINQVRILREGRKIPQRQKHEPRAGNEAADAGELGHVDEAAAQLAAAGHPRTRFQQISQTDKLHQ